MSCHRKGIWWRNSVAQLLLVKCPLFSLLLCGRFWIRNDEGYTRTEIYIIDSKRDIQLIPTFREALPLILIDLQLIHLELSANLYNPTWVWQGTSHSLLFGSTRHQSPGIFLILTCQSPVGSSCHSRIKGILYLILSSPKDLGHFPHQSAQLKGISLACGIIAHILTQHYYTRLSRIEHFICNPEPSGWARYFIQINGAIFEVQTAYHSQRWLKIIFTWRVLYLHKYLIQFDSNFSLQLECSAL